ncbi:hypothetical protein FRX31_010885 [Thalictrum thalictroides]|uniref:Uncharacterized protein n=1 Tax=Thalictrum thalictroides TaxID=46969 RepID=A0A7J6WRJ0_THATH|nr:hypothetical protein FRX31_010885 [Thalictrum thalictroides]
MWEDTIVASVDKDNLDSLQITDVVCSLTKVDGSDDVWSGQSSGNNSGSLENTSCDSTWYAGDGSSSSVKSHTKSKGKPSYFQ